MPHCSPYLSAFCTHFHTEALTELDQKFLAYLHDHDPVLKKELLNYRQDASRLTALQTSELLLAVAPVLESFITQLFMIQNAVNFAQQKRQAQLPIFEFKKWFVQRRARRRLSQTIDIQAFNDLDQWLSVQLQATNSPKHQDRELAVALLAKSYLANAAIYTEQIENLTQWCIQALKTPEGQAAVRHWISFKLPQHINPHALVPMQFVPHDAWQRQQGAHHTPRQRQDFRLTDPRMSVREVLNEVNYCIYCHDHEGDFCSHGFPEKKGEPTLKKNALGVTLTGCPLDEKISEMHSLVKQGYIIAPLAVILIDNPLCPITGHRICNDCMKACVYQKQEPVNIPQIETHCLTEVLDLPWGLEIYDLLVRWNPLRAKQYLPKPYNGLKVLIAGQGPAGITLAHHLLMEGFAVVGIEGLKLESLPSHILTNPVNNYQQLVEKLDERIVTGFGGVAEYGITVRWDKNFLKLIYLNLVRRPYFQAFGSVRFGGSMTVEKAWSLGFDHVAIAVGAGLPKALSIANSLAVGMRQANDFLMTLQLMGAAKIHSLTNLQIRLPAVVIGGGLTGIDAATELQAYYLVQIEKTLQRYEQLVSALGDAHVHASLDVVSFDILAEHLEHAHALRAERAKAWAAGKAPNVQALLHAWGGVTVVYRRSLQESPAYISNHEEVLKALEEGIYYAEGLEPVAVRVDTHKHVTALVCRRKANDLIEQQEVILPARTVLVATGAQPNIAYEFEHKGHFQRIDNATFQYQPFEQTSEGLQATPIAAHCKADSIGMFTSYQLADKRVTFLGDTHPVFQGNVVKAIASGKRAYPDIVRLFGERTQKPGNREEYSIFRERMQTLLMSHVIHVKRHNKQVVELLVHSPLAAQQYQPGQFFRVQNYETTASFIGNTRLQTEAIAMLGAGVNVGAGTIRFMVLEQGASSKIFATVHAGDPIAVMGPTGAKISIPQNETVMIMGGRLAIATVLGLAPILKAAGNRILYIACLPNAEAVYCQAELEQVTDAILWVTATGHAITPQRTQDCYYVGDFVTALQLYARGELGQIDLDLQLYAVNKVFVVGPAQMVRRIQQARTTTLHEYFQPHCQFTASVHGAMQCMLKGVCAQCLQWQIDPVTQQRTKAVFACSWQNQPIDIIDISHLNERLTQNRLQESLTSLWLDYLFMQYDIHRV